jgi:hypothetical protein
MMYATGCPPSCIDVGLADTPTELEGNTSAIVIVTVSDLETEFPLLSLSRAEIVFVEDSPALPDIVSTYEQL